MQHSKSTLEEAPATTTSVTACLQEVERLEQQLGREWVKSGASALPHLGANNLAAELLKSVPEGSALVEFALTGKGNGARYAAFVLRQDAGVALLDLGPAGDIEKEISSFRREVRRGASAETPVDCAVQAGLVVRRRLWDPLMTVLGPLPKHLFLAPDGALFKLPFAALPLDPQGTTPQRYVLHLDMTISFLTAGRDLLRGLSSPTPSSLWCRVVANPKFGCKVPLQQPSDPVSDTRDGEEFVDLMGTELEGKKVKDLLEGCKALNCEVELLFSEAATKEAFLTTRVTAPWPPA